MNLFETVTTVEMYRVHLEKLYGWLLQEEARLSPVIVPPSFELKARLRSSLLLSDLAALGSKIDPDKYVNTKFIDSEASMIGRLYVLEGSTLGGAVIYRHFSEKLGLGAADGLSYYLGRPKDSVNWKSFLAALTEYFEANPLKTEEVILSAIATFASFQMAME